MPDGLSLTAILLYLTARWVYAHWLEQVPPQGEEGARGCS
jgi:hypothetical protein